MHIVVHGHWGPPMILFPTSGGDEGEYERQSLIGAIGDQIDAGRVKTFSVNLNHDDCVRQPQARIRSTAAGCSGSTTRTSGTR